MRFQIPKIFSHHILPNVRSFIRQYLFLPWRSEILRSGKSVLSRAERVGFMESMDFKIFLRMKLWRIFEMKSRRVLTCIRPASPQNSRAIVNKRSREGAPFSYKNTLLTISKTPTPTLFVAIENKEEEKVNFLAFGPSRKRLRFLFFLPGDSASKGPAHIRRAEKHG